MKHRWLYVIALMVGVSTLAACNDKPLVRIEYDQVVNFIGYKTDACLDPALSCPHYSGGLYVLYKINKIDNSISGADTFVFDSHKVRAYGWNEKAYLSFTVTNLTVPPGQTKYNPGCFIQNLPGGNPLSSELVTLDYASDDQEQYVSMEQAPGDTTTTNPLNYVPETTLKNLCV